MKWGNLEIRKYGHELRVYHCDVLVFKLKEYPWAGGMGIEFKDGSEIVTNMGYATNIVAPTVSSGWTDGKEPTSLPEKKLMAVPADLVPVVKVLLEQAAKMKG